MESNVIRSWADLPNAKYIDAVIDHVKANPMSWSISNSDGMEAREIRTGMRTDARDIAWSNGRRLIWKDVRTQVMMPNGAQTYHKEFTAWNTVVALVTWDHCGSMLEMDPDALQVLVNLGIPAAILLHPACKILHRMTP